MKRLHSPWLRSAVLIAAVVAQGMAYRTAAARPETPPQEMRKYLSVGAGLQRDLPPSQLIPDPAQAPKGAAEGHPDGVTFRDGPLGLVYITQEGRTLYGMKVLRLRYSGAPETYCTGACTEIWKALPAAADAKPIGAWNVVTGAQGPQWAYGKNPVFMFSGDKQPGDLNGHEFDDAFMAINYIPPIPVVQAPGGVEPLFVNHREYVAAYQGRPLYAYPAGTPCPKDCDRLVPFAAPLGAKDIGAWAVAQGADRPLWTYAGKQLFLAAADGRDIVDEAAMLRLK